jgi:hypothetical protein
MQLHTTYLLIGHQEGMMQMHSSIGKRVETATMHSYTPYYFQSQQYQGG